MIVRSTSLMNPMWHRWWHAVRVGIKERPIRGAVRITLILGEGAGRGAENDHNAKSNLGLVQHRCIFPSRFAPRLGNRWVPRRHPLNLRSGNRQAIAQFACGLLSPVAARSRTKPPRASSRRSSRPKRDGTGESSFRPSTTRARALAGQFNLNLAALASPFDRPDFKTISPIADAF